MRERRTLILFPTAMDPWQCVCQWKLLRKLSSANFVICIYGGDGLQKSFERFELFHGLLYLCVPKQRVPTGILCDWYLVKESQRDDI